LNAIFSRRMRVWLSLSLGNFVELPLTWCPRFSSKSSHHDIAVTAN